MKSIKRNKINKEIKSTTVCVLTLIRICCYICGLGKDQNTISDLSMEKSRSFPRIRKYAFTIEILFCSCPKKVLKIKNENMQVEKQKPSLAQQISPVMT